MAIDWQGVYEHWDDMDKINKEKFWEAEKQRLLADLEGEDQTRPSAPPPKRFGLFKRARHDRGDDR